MGVCRGERERERETAREVGPTLCVPAPRPFRYSKVMYEPCPCTRITMALAGAPSLGGQ
jgi:hypothetical protein